MLKAIRNFIMIVTVIFSFTNIALAYRVEIIPGNPLQLSLYLIREGQEVDFIAKAYTGEEKDTKSDKELPVERLFWRFDYAYFEKISSIGDVIRLKALKEGKVILTVVGIVENNPFTKSIEITIEK